MSSRLFASGAAAALTAVVALLGCASARTSTPAAPTVPADSGYLPGAGGTRLHYLRVGRGPQAVLIPGRLFLANDFRRLASPERTLVFYDTRNRGRSDPVADTTALTVQHDVLDVEAVRRHFGFDSVALVGYSYMGLMVVMYAMDHPDRVTRIVQIGPVARKYGTEYPRALTAADHPAPYDSARFAEARRLSETAYPAERPREFCELVWSVQRVGLVGDQSKVDALGPGQCDMPNEHPVNFWRHLRFNFASVQRVDIPAEAVRRVRVPVLTIHGTWDRNAVYGGGREWALTLPDARLITLPGAAHSPWVERPETVFPAVDEFLRGRWPAAAERVTTLDPAATAPDTGTLKLDGGGLFYEVAGAGPGVVLIHGGFGDRRMWDDQFAALASRYRVVRYDHRGFGRSPAPNADYSPVADLARLLDHLGMERAHLVGNSMGGTLALDFALRHPERVRRLVLLASGPSGYPATEEDKRRFAAEGAAVAAVFAAADSGGPERAVAAWIAHPMVAVTSRDPRAAPLLRRMIRENAGIFRMRHWPSEPMDPPALARLGEVRAPTLVLIGEHDIALARGSGEAAAAIPGARVVVVRGADHLPQMARPAEVNRLLLDFLNRG